MVELVSAKFLAQLTEKADNFYLMNSAAHRQMATAFFPVPEDSCAQGRQSRP